MCHSNKNDLLNTNRVGVKHQVKAGDKYDLKLQKIKNRETLHTFIWK